MTLDDKNLIKSRNEHSCEICNYKTLSKSDYNKHLLTSKHKKNISDDKNNDINRNLDDVKRSFNDINININKFVCECGKIYKYRQGIFKHKSKCNFKEKEKENIIKEPIKFEPTINMFMEIMKENQEMKKLLLEQNTILINKFVEKDLINNTQNITNNTNVNTNNTINNNQKFNLNIFLNETCKDAMNMKEFIDNIKITFEQLLNIGDAGFVSGVSEIFVKQLRDLEITKRPIHCTDVKRETIYVKEEDRWDKDDKDNTKLKTAIERVEYRNLAALHKWCKENPDSKVNNSKQNLLRDKIHLQVLQGDDKTRDKIIKNISREITIDKNENHLI